MELEDLKTRWEEQDRKLDTAIRLNARLLTESALTRAETALEPLSRLLWFELVSSLVPAVWLGSFLAHVSEIRFLIPAAALHLCAIAVILVTVRQLVALRTIDYGSPVVAIQKRLESLRIERIRAVKLTLLFAPLLWTPLMIVTLKGLFDVDAYEALGAGYLIANLLLGLLLIPLAVFLSRRYSGGMGRSPFVQRLMRDLAGKSLTSATGFLSSISQFEKDESRADPPRQDPESGPRP